MSTAAKPKTAPALAKTPDPRRKRLKEGEKSFGELTNAGNLSRKSVRADWNLPASSVVRDKAAQIAAMRIQGHSDAEIAEAVELQPRTLKQYLYLAAKNGWLRFDDPGDRLNIGLANKIVDNVEYHLNKKDKVMTIEAARGIGLFKSHQTIKNESETPNMLLALKIEMPEPKDGSTAVQVAVPAGAIMGAPRRNV